MANLSKADDSVIRHFVSTLFTLGKLDLTDSGLWRRDEYVVRQCLQRGIPVTTVIGGGYDKNLDVLAARQCVQQQHFDSVPSFPTFPLH